MPLHAERFDARAFRPIEAMAYSFRTFNHRRDYSLTSGADDRPANTLDQIVSVTMPLLRCVWPDAIMTRRVML